MPYIPPAFREPREAVLHEVIRQHSFGTLISQVEGELFATHLPFGLLPDAGPHGTLVAHLARANPQWHSFAESELLAIFQGPHAYISPSWYTTPVAVPTWNYVAVHAYGRARIVSDPAAVQQMLRELVATYESGFDQPWTMDGLPDGYAEQLATGVVAFEIEITHLEGKFKLSQNRSTADLASAINGLRQHGGTDGRAVAQMMEERLQLPGSQTP